MSRDNVNKKLKGIIIIMAVVYTSSQNKLQQNNLSILHNQVVFPQLFFDTTRFLTNGFYNHCNRTNYVMVFKKQGVFLKIANNWQKSNQFSNKGTKQRWRKLSSNPTPPHVF